MTSKPQPGVSLRTIARLAGVSVSTASRALHDHPVISAPVRKKIKDLARRRGYQINPLVAQVYSEARAGRGFRHLGTLAYVTAYDTRDWWKAHPTLRGFHAGVVERAKETGLGVDEFWAHEPGLKGKRLTQILRARGIGGVVLAPVPARTAAEMLEWKYFSAALIGESVLTPRLNRAVPNQRHAVQVALQHLTQLGYRRIGLVLRRRYHAMTDYNMLSAFLVFQFGIPADQRVPVETPDDWNEQNFMAWFKRHKPDAIIGAVHLAPEWLARAGVQCPRDVGLTVLDWDEETRETFAAVDQNAAASGAAAVDIVLSQMRRNERGIPAIPRTVLVDTHWRPGRSVREVGPAWTPEFLPKFPEPASPEP
ncbi:MAG: LacI family DNA-binding transcriptional regulator [Verrucomicrobiota bacterium]